jgi:hypothetical protein
MKKKTVAIGYENFQEVITKDIYYVDKTLLIKELLDSKNKVTLFTRPRRFGKTLNLSTIKYFFGDTGDEALNEENRHLFDGLKIAEAGEEYLQHMQQYPVISLSLKSAKFNTYEISYEAFKSLISDEFIRHYNNIIKSDKLLDVEKKRYEKIMNLEGSTQDYANSIKLLSSCLSKVYSKKCIILIDEYDVPLENAYSYGFYDEMIVFIRSLFESAFKTNDNLEFAVITGCLRISKESIFTGMNNLQVESIISKTYGEYFGFTEAEVTEMTEYCGCSERLSDLKAWYDGYMFGDTEVYNPWSILNFLYDLRADINEFTKPYWSNTSSNSIVKELIYEADDEVQADIETLIAGGTVTKPVHEEVTYAEVKKSPDNLWNFLFFTGYLKMVSQYYSNGQLYVELAIPNKEVKNIYIDQVKNRFVEKAKTKDLSEFNRALLAGDADALQHEITLLLSDAISYMDCYEAFYHGVLLAWTVLLSGSGYRISSNRESGYGRYDLCVINIDVNVPAIIIEVKKADSFTDMPKAAERAVQQIKDKKYNAEIAMRGIKSCRHIGIAFFGKDCAVKAELVAVEG